MRTIDTAGKTDNNLGYFKIFKHELREAGLCAKRHPEQEQIFYEGY